jgi:hypothetical protein
MKGRKTLAVGLAMAILPTALTYLAGIDWTTVLPAQYAPIVAGLVMIAMRLVTTGPVAGLAKKA